MRRISAVKDASHSTGCRGCEGRTVAHNQPSLSVHPLPAGSQSRPGPGERFHDPAPSHRLWRPIHLYLPSYGLHSVLIAVLSLYTTPPQELHIFITKEGPPSTRLPIGRHEAQILQLLLVKSFLTPQQNIFCFP